MKTIIITAGALFALTAPVLAQSALDDPDTQRILSVIDAKQARSQAILDAANAYNPSGDQFYPGTNQILQNATDGSGALRIAR